MGNEIEGLTMSVAQNEKILERRKWIQMTIQRLKSSGMSDCCIRNVVCSHLPNGSGPPDRENAPSFGDEDLHKCKKTYLDEVEKPIAKISAYVHDLTGHRRQLRDARRILYNV